MCLCFQKLLPWALTCHLSFLQDKLGPFCRSATDCAVVLDIIRGKDPDDLSSRDNLLDDPFLVDITKLTVGYLDDAEMEVSDPSNLGSTCNSI